MSITFLYILLVILPNLNMLLIALLAFLVVFIIVSGACLLARVEGGQCDKTEWTYVLKISKTVSIILLTLVILVTIIPSKKDILIISGIYLITQVEGIDKIPENIVKFINNEIEDLNK